MQIIHEQGSFFIYRCECGKDFEVDAATEENCEYIWNGHYGYNVAKCPKCGRIDK